MNAPVKPTPGGRGYFRRTPPLTHARAMSLLNYDPQTGLFVWKQYRAANARPGDLAGYTCGRYVTIQIDRLNYRAHRVAWLLRTGAWPTCLIDHINGNGHDNRWVNLREADYCQNAQNRCVSRRNKSGQPGVSKDTQTGKWLSEIGVQGKSIRLGRFECQADAVAARCKAEKHYFGSFARVVREAKDDAK